MLGPGRTRLSPASGHLLRYGDPADAKWPAAAASPDVQFKILWLDAADRAEEMAAQPPRVDRVVDGRDAHPKAPRDDGDRQKELGPQKLGPPQIRRNSVREPVSTGPIGWNRWQSVYGFNPRNACGIQGLRAQAKPCQRMDPFGVGFGTKGSQVQILSPRLRRPRLRTGNRRCRGLRFSRFSASVPET
jgi:hypothetical protein